MHNQREVIIIGAGISGLVCAYRLQQLGVDVLLVEKTKHAGGVIQSEKINGFLIERGPNSARGIAELLNLVDELELQEELLEGNPRAPAFVYFNNRLRAVPMGPRELLASDLLSVRGKLRLLREPFLPKRPSEDEESVRDFFSRRLGSEVAERLVAPFVSGIFAGDTNRLSTEAAFPHLANLERGYGSLFRGAIAKAREAKRITQKKPKTRRSISFRSGMHVLTETLASRLGENLLPGADCRLQGFDAGPQENENRFKLSVRRGNVEEIHECRHLVIATPADTAALFIENVSSELSALLQEIEYAPLVILHLAYEQSQIAASLDGFGFLASPSAELTILGCLFSSSQFENRAPAGSALLTVFIGGARHSEHAQRNDDELVAVSHKELKIILGISSSPRVISVTRLRRAIPQYNLGHAERVRGIENIVNSTQGLYLVGNYLHGVSVGDCVKEAEMTAGEIYKAV